MSSRRFRWSFSSAFQQMRLPSAVCNWSSTSFGGPGWVPLEVLGGQLPRSVQQESSITITDSTCTGWISQMLQGRHLNQVAAQSAAHAAVGELHQMRLRLDKLGTGCDFCCVDIDLRHVVHNDSYLRAVTATALIPCI